MTVYTKESHPREWAIFSSIDTNDDGNIDIGDPVALLGVLFSGAAPPSTPFPECGQDPTADTLDCEFGPTRCP